MKTIILIDTSDVGAAYSAEAVKKLGFKPLFLINFNDFQGDTVRQVKQYPHYQVDTKSLAALLTLIEKEAISDIGAVFTTLDARIPIALALASKLKVRGMCPNLNKVINKADVVHFVPEYSPKSMAFTVSDFPKEKVRLFTQQVDRCLLKPTNAAGGVGAKQFEAGIDEHSVLKHIANFPHTDWLLMEYIDGILTSLEGFVLNNTTYFLGFTSRGKIGNTESYTEFPHDETISPSTQKKAKDAVRVLIERSGCTHGYFHSEFMVTEHSAYLIDANFGRIGGGSLLEMIAFSFDLSAIEIMQHILLVTLFPEKKIPLPYLQDHRKKSVGINYGLLKPGKLQLVKVKCNSKIKHTLLLDSGTMVPAMGENNWAWIGLLSGLKADVLKAIANITIITDSGKATPCY